MKCDLVVEKERCGSIIIERIQNSIPTTYNTSKWKTSYSEDNVKHVNSEDTTNKLLATNYSENKPYSNVFTIENKSKSLANQMMAAIGQPSSAPPNCGGAPQTTVDPR